MIEYRRLANALPQIIWTCDAHGRLEWINDRWFELTGQPVSELSTEDGAFAAIHTDDRAELRSTWRAAVESASAAEIEYRIRTRDGEYRWHLARMAPVRGDDGTIVRFAAIAIDMHDRRLTELELRASQGRFDTAFEQNPLPMIVLRLRDMRFVRVNDAFVQFSGFSRAEAEHKNAVKLGMWSEEDRSAGMQEIATSRIEVTMRVKDGSSRIVQLSAAQIMFGDEACLLVAAVDMTEQRATEQALRDADRRKDEFLAVLSHELRNPLAPIVTVAQLMKLRGDPSTTREADVLLRQARHLSRLVDDLLDVSRIARGEIQLARQRLSLSRVIANAVEATEPLFELHRHRLSLHETKDLFVDADEVRLTQIISNLLTNAARYTPSQGRIEVRTERDGDHAVIRVVDNGRGIDASLLSSVFTPFVRGARDVDRAHAGLGLGLALVRSLTELHGGTVTAASDGPDRGSTFTVRLPLAVRLAAASSSPVFAAHVAQPMRILVVDDNQDAAQMLAKALGRVGHHVRVAFDAAEALAVVESFTPDVAILDIGLPVMDGHALARELVGRLAVPPMLVALTGYGRPQDRERSMAAGFAFHLDKPVDLDALQRLLAGGEKPPDRV